MTSGRVPSAASRCRNFLLEFVVARAALSWSAAIKELAFVLDPSLEVRVEIDSGTQCSFSLNSLGLPRTRGHPPRVVQAELHGGGGTSCGSLRAECYCERVSEGPPWV